VTTLSLIQFVAGSNNISKGNRVSDLLDVIFLRNNENNSQLVKFYVVVFESVFFNVGNIEDSHPKGETFGSGILLVSFGVFFSIFSRFAILSLIVVVQLLGQLVHVGVFGSSLLAKSTADHKQ